MSWIAVDGMGICASCTAERPLRRGTCEECAHVLLQLNKHHEREQPITEPSIEPSAEPEPAGAGAGDESSEVGKPTQGAVVSGGEVSAGDGPVRAYGAKGKAKK